MVNSLFPKIFKKWKERGTHHSITIAFSVSMDLSDVPFEELKPGQQLKTTTDYYRIVVDQVNIIHWVKIMESLRKEFMKITEELKNLRQKQENGEHSIIKGRFSPVMKSNFLELVNFATTILTNPFKQLDLRHTTTHVIIISPGSGLYDVNYDLLRLTGKKLLSLEMTMDLICLSRAPLHIVPLFRYMDYENKLHHCTPSWLSIFFWNDSSKNSLNEWQPRCRIYNLQMMGVTEQEIVDEVDINYLQAKKGIKSVSQLIDDYDRNIFRSSVDLDSPLNSESLEDNNFAEKKNIIISSRNGVQNIQVVASLAWNTPKFSSPMLEDIQKPKVLADLYHQTKSITIPPNFMNSSLKPSTDWKLPKDIERADQHSLALDTLKGINKKESISNMFKQKILNRFLPEREYDSKMLITESVKPTFSGEILDRNDFDKRNLEGRKPSTARNAPIIKKNLTSFLKIDNDTFKTNTDENSTNSSMDTVPSIKLNLTDRYRHFYQDGDVKEPTKSTHNIMTKTPYNTNKTWSEIENPSIPVNNEVAGLLLSVRWRDVLPRYVAKKYSKWRSFTTPAELPLTTISFPSVKEFREDYLLRNHSVTLNIDQEMYNQNFKNLLLNMIYMRLVTGFQICIGDEVEEAEYSMTKDKDSQQVFKYLPEEDWTNTKIYLKLDIEIHRISCGLEGVIDVQRYLKNEEQNPLDQVSSYIPLVKTRYESTYRTSKIDPLHAARESLNWNQIDQVLAGYGDYTTDNNWFGFKSKFVVLPADIPPSTSSTVVNGRNEILSPEELRLEGIRRLIALISRSKLKTANEKVTKSGKDEIQPEISFYTGSLYNFIQEQRQSLHKLSTKDSIFNNEKGELARDVSLKTLAEKLQTGDGRLTLVTRKWHWDKHNNCFIGSDMVNWIIRNFKDIENRDDATEFGQSLMDRKLFVHVLNKHGFLDGYYFYRIAPEFFLNKIHLEKESASSRSAGNGNTNDKVEMNIKNIYTNTSLDITETNSSLSNEEQNNNNKPSKSTIILSNSLIIDLDSEGKSYKQETCIAHFDKVHNPDHCFHVRLQWMTATPKLIDDTIKNWSRLCEKYGLILIEVPWEELCSIPSIDPFHSFIDIKLAINPWEDQEFNDSELFSKSKFYYQIYLLRSSGFLLDNRAFAFINNADIEFDIKYSWGTPKFKNAQYIHKTGGCIAELKENGELFLAPNNIYIARTNLANVVGKTKKANRSTLDAQRIMLDLKNKCSDYGKLRSIFLDAKERWLKTRNIEE